MPPSLLRLLWLLLGPGPALLAQAGPYCGSDTPLSTPYFAPFHKRAEAALGCQAASPAGAAHQVHVLRLTGRLPEVFLDVSGPAPVSLVLMSAVPTVWHLATTTRDTVPSILVSQGSSVVEAATGRGLEARATMLTSLARASKIGLGMFGHLNSVTTVAKEANRVFVALPGGLEAKEPCPPGLGQPPAYSKAVTAYMVERQSSYGCYHPEAAGLLPNDVHVIDLRDGGPGRHRRTLTSPLPEVTVELGPELAAGRGPLPRNLTLVLKSDSRVRWMLRSSGIQGRLLVTAGDNPVEKVEVDTMQRLEVQQAAMPDQFDGLMAEVTNQYGRPLSYLRVHHANLLQLTIPPRSKRELASLWDARPAPETGHTTGTRAKSMDEQIYAAAEALESGMVKTCDEARKEMSVSVPAATIAQYGVGAITLNDASCEALPAGPVWSVVSHSTKCGSTALIMGSVPMYRNNLNIRFEAGPLAGQNTKISFICKFRPCIPGVSCSTTDGDEEEEEEDYTDNEMDEGEEMYSISVKRVDGEERVSLLEKRGDSALVAVGEEIHVSSYINAVPYLALAMEQCWVSASPQASSHARPQDTRLIVAGCPVREDVSLHWDEGSSNSAFTLHVPAGLSPPGRPVWLQCRMGLCSATTAGAGGNILRCLQPSEACRANTTHEESALQQVTVRGPIYLSPSPPRRPAHARDEEAEDLEDLEGEDPGHSAQPSSRTLVEVPVEVAIAISLASFLVGALSTGVLWFLHNRALRAKSERAVQEQLRSVLAGDGTELHSMLSTGGPPGTTSPGDHNGNCPTCPLVAAS